MKLRRILIVDDNKPIAQGLKSTLESKLDGDYFIEIATDAKSAYKLSRQETYAIAFLDVNLEYGMNGIELARRLLTKNPKLVVVIMSATHHDDNIKKSVASIGAEFLEKPVDSDVLLAKIEESLDDNDFL